MLVNANNSRSHVNGVHALVGSAMRAAKQVLLGCTDTHILTMAMVRMAHPTTVIHFYSDLSCRRISLTSPYNEIRLFEQYWH